MSIPSGERLCQLLKVLRFTRKTPEIAYEFREALRLRNWSQALNSIRKYREIRTALCANYMDGAEEMLKLAKSAKL